ncbi:hypothetical protein [Caldimonas sp. KR1-144]|uniref:hypothetical protein n=1 Tax=Caldimonas sp. KR1-144 TaxID=3400911 RepID=UPI003BFD148F
MIAASLRAAALALASTAALAALPADVTSLVEQAEAALARGDAAAATQRFEAAAERAHEAGIETGIVRAAMQSGRYREALAFAAHTAGVHADEAEGVALYAWLLSVGGQQAAAVRTLEAARGRVDDAALLDAVSTALATPSAAPAARTQASPPLFAPYAVGAQPPAPATVIATGLLIDGGRRALAPAQLLAKDRPLWLRNGLGQTVQAHVEAIDAATGIALLQLASPLPSPAAAWAASDAFPGSPAGVLQFAAGPDTPAWPRLSQGFLGQPIGEGARRRLGIDVPPTAPGGPVTDMRGHLVGIASTAADGAPTLVTVSRLRAAGFIGDAAPTAAPPQRLAPDELYERGLRLALQVIASPRTQP